MTDYATKLHTLHYGAVTAREPWGEDAQAVCRVLGRRFVMIDSNPEALAVMQRRLGGPGTRFVDVAGKALPSPAPAPPPAVAPPATRA